MFNQIINVLKNLIMNLENLNLVELNAQEMKDIEGGFLLELLCLVVGIIVGVNLYNATH